MCDIIYEILTGFFKQIINSQKKNKLSNELSLWFILVWVCYICINSLLPSEQRGATQPSPSCSNYLDFPPLLPFFPPLPNFFPLLGLLFNCWSLVAFFCLSFLTCSLFFNSERTWALGIDCRCFPPLNLLLSIRPRAPTKKIMLRDSMQFVFIMAGTNPLCWCECGKKEKEKRFWWCEIYAGVSLRPGTQVCL